MPYCVSCGVKLKSSEKKCPLCETPIILPEPKPDQPGCEQPPSRRDEIMDAFDKDLWIKLISVITIAPTLITLAIDYFFGGGISWSLYVLLSLTLVWIWCVSPFLFPRNIFSLWFFLDTAALCGFLFFTEYLSKTGRWFYPLALPLVAILALMVFTAVILFRLKIIHQLQKPALLFFQAGFLCLSIELIVDLYKFSRYLPGWSLLAAIPCFAFGIILLILQGRQWIVEEIKHWFRI